MAREAPRYRTALIDGTLLRRVPDVEALFVLANGGFWDSELSNIFTQQLNSPQAIYTLAALFTPPGHVVERRTIAALTNIERVTSFVSSLSAPGDPWLAESFKRFTMTLDGKNPAFADDND